MDENVKISELPVASTIASPDVAPIVQGGVTKQADVSLFGGSSLWNFVSADNSDTNIASTNYQTVVSQSLTISANDTIIVDIWGTLLNNSGSARTYSHQLNVGSVAVFDFTEGGTSGAASATDRAIRHLQFIVSVSATNVWRALQEVPFQANGNAANTPPTVGSAGLSVWNSGTNDLTGSQAISYKIKSSNGTTTQTFTLHSYIITRIPKNP